MQEIGLKGIDEKIYYDICDNGLPIYMLVNEKVNKELKDLSIREWECTNCHFMHDRDINASLNILDEGIKLYLKDLQIEKSI